MVVGKFVTKLIRSLPSWEVTKYYGRVCWFQLQCFKYRIQTSETWFNFRRKFMPNSLRSEAENEVKQSNKGGKESMGIIAKSALLKQKFDKLRKIKKKEKESDFSQDNKEGIQICVKANKKSKDKNVESTSKK